LQFCNFGYFSVCIAHELWLRQQPKLVEHG
jgi:hypothetical protein